MTFFGGYNRIGSGVLPGKTLLVRIIENSEKFMLILSQVRLSKGYLCPPGLETASGARIGKMALFSIILDQAFTGRATDPQVLIDSRRGQFKLQ